MLQDGCFLGLDLSTQSLTALLVSLASGVIRQFSINFDRAYPRYGTVGGVLPSPDPLRAHVDPMMWVEALDDALGRLQQEGLAGRIAAVAVSAQQHGTVYLNRRAATALAGLNPSHSLACGLTGIFARKTCPVWMDASTRLECGEITASLGGDAAVARLTGSVATERFAGPQIRKFWKEDPEAYGGTAHIALISSFVTALLVGRTAPVDAGDGYGTNLADIRSGAWSPAAMDATAPGLQQRLPRLVAKDDRVGRVSPYLVKRFGFNPNAVVAVGSGDNPCSLVGLGMIGNADVHAVSLGTSDTVFGYMPEPGRVDRVEGHLFGAADGGHMFLVCFKNGSLAREQVKNSYGLSWDDFSRILMETPAGNNGRVLLPYFLPEITPPVPAPAVRRFGGLACDDVRGNVRGVAEAQAMSMVLHSAWAGPRPKSVLVTAGGSENLGLLTVIAQVFGAEVRTLEVKESAALGAAIRAAHACLNRDRFAIGWRELWETVAGAASPQVIRPSAAATRIYRSPGGLLDVYAACERFALGRGPDPGGPIRAFQGVFTGP
jgi:xylulokinase